MKNIDILFSNNLTAISGQNSTGKSTILGLIGQIFVFYKKYKTINNSSFETKYSEIFKFCPIYEYSAEHNYDVIINEENNEIIKKAKSRFSPKEGKQGRFRIDIGERDEEGKGAINFPVLYLGLKRLFPLAQEKEDSIKINILDLEESEKNFYKKYAQDILILLDGSITPQNIKSPNKEFLAMETSNYSNIGNSAGQDNLGQILTAILSFRRLKNNLGDQYKGGILLIDEVDATLYAGSQIILIKRLYKFSMDLNLQIIFTTHSLEILELLSEKKDWGTVINYFKLSNNKVSNEINPSFSKIKNNILVQTKKQYKIERIHVLCEDKVTKSWCKNLLNYTQEKKMVFINEVPIGSGTLIELAKKKHPVFKKMLFVLDGDQKREAEGLNRVICLPSNSSPEKTIYKFLNSIDEDDDYWDNDHYFTKQVCFNEFIDTNQYKPWFSKKCGIVENSLTKIFNKWKKENSDKVKEFQLEFKNNLEKVLS